MRKGVLLLSVIILMSVAFAAEVNCSPPAIGGTGDWTISSDTRCESRTITIPENANLVVNAGAHLDLYDCTLIFNMSASENVPHGIDLNGNLTLNQTTVMSSNLSDVNGWNIVAEATTQQGWYKIERCTFINPSSLNFQAYSNSHITNTIAKNNPYDSCNANGKPNQLVNFYSSTHGPGENVSVDGFHFNNISSKQIWDYLPDYSTVNNISNDEDCNCVTGRISSRYYNFARGADAQVSDVNIYINMSGTPSPYAVSFDGSSGNQNYTDITVKGFTGNTYFAYASGSIDKNLSFTNLNVSLITSAGSTGTYPIFFLGEMDFTNLILEKEAGVTLGYPERSIYIRGYSAVGQATIVNMSMNGFPENLSDFSELDFFNPSVYQYYQPIIQDSVGSPIIGATLNVSHGDGSNPQLTTGVSGYPLADNNSLLLIYEENTTSTYYYNTSAEVYFGANKLGDINETWANWDFSFTSFNFSIPASVPGVFPNTGAKSVLIDTKLQQNSTVYSFNISVLDTTGVNSSAVYYRISNSSGNTTTWLSMTNSSSGNVSWFTASANSTVSMGFYDIIFNATNIAGNENASETLSFEITATQVNFTPTTFIQGESIVIPEIDVSWNSTVSGKGSTSTSLSADQCSVTINSDYNLVYVQNSSSENQTISNTSSSASWDCDFSTGNYTVFYYTPAVTNTTLQNTTQYYSEQDYIEVTDSWLYVTGNIELENANMITNYNNVEYSFVESGMDISFAASDVFESYANFYNQTTSTFSPIFRVGIDITESPIGDPDGLGEYAQGLTYSLPSYARDVDEAKFTYTITDGWENVNVWECSDFESDLFSKCSLVSSSLNGNTLTWTGHLSDVNYSISYSVGIESSGSGGGGAPTFTSEVFCDDNVDNDKDGDIDCDDVDCSEDEYCIAAIETTEAEEEVQTIPDSQEVIGDITETLGDAFSVPISQASITGMTIEGFEITSMHVIVGAVAVIVLGVVVYLFNDTKSVKKMKFKKGRR